MTKEIDRNGYRYRITREVILRLVDQGKSITASDIFERVVFKIGFLHIPKKETMSTTVAAIKDMVEERLVEPVSSLNPWTFKATGILDRIVGALDASDG